MKPNAVAPRAWLALAPLAIASCAPAAPIARPAPPPTAFVSQPIASSSASAPIARKPPSPPRPPPPVARVAMPGEPDGAAVSEARLVVESCEKLEALEKRRTDELVKEMKAEVDASFKEWAASQPACWQDFRARAADQMAMKFGSGEAYGMGSLGLSGVGAGGGGFGMGMGASGVTVGGAPPAPRKASSVSGTNDQVAGVDEADLVKTDGRWVYLASQGALRIVEALNPHVVSTTPIAGAVREMFVEGDRAVVYSSSGRPGRRCTYGYDCQFAGDGTSTTISVLDVTNRAAPKVVRTIQLSGSLMTARRIGNAVHTVVADGDSPRESRFETWPADLETCGTPQATVVAKFARLKRDNETKLRARKPKLPTIAENGTARTTCGSMYETAFPDGEAFTTLVSFDLADDRTPPSTITLQSRPGAVFASADALYVAVVHRRGATGGRWYSFYPSVDETSEIHAFRLGKKASDARYVGSGVVPGHVLNQFSMDEEGGYLRIATTRGRVPDPKVASVVSVLATTDGGNLVRVGSIEGIAPGEDIRAVRFDGDRGYVVTFKKTDPLFVLDLWDPAHPSILGELKIPGFSTYMHRIDADHLLSIGLDADDHGSFAFFDGVILQLFDVHDPVRPELLFKEKIGTRGSSSEAVTNHLAFNYLGDRGLLAIPMTICEGGGDGRNGDVLSFSGLLVYHVDLDRGFERLGGINHGTRGVSCGTWWSHATSAVKRSVFLDDLVYSIADDRVKVQRLGRFGEDVADIPLAP